MRNGFELALTISPRMVSVVRRFVEEMSERMGADHDLSGRVALAAHELLENVAKYGQAGEGLLRLESVAAGGERRLVLTVKNVTSPDHVDRLRQTFQEMHGSGDPFGYYFGLMNSDLADEPGGLGLARIPAEAEMPLQLSLAGGAVTICASSGPYAPTTETSP